MKKVVLFMMIIVLSMGLIACNDGGAKELSDKKYQQLMENMGLEGMENVVEGSLYAGAYCDKINYKEEFPSFAIKLSKICGEKKTIQYVFYELGMDEAQAYEMQEQYKSYLLAQGYEFYGTGEVLEDYSTLKDIYINDSSAVAFCDVQDPVTQDGEANGQYRLPIYFY